MVPFGKAAFFSGKVVHTNEFLVLIGEGYYAECSASKTLEILGRRGTLLASQIAGVKSQLADLDAEAFFFNETFVEAAAGCVEIREEFPESTTSSSSVGILEPEPPDYEGASLNSEIDGRVAASKEVILTDHDKEHELLMARLDEIEAAEAAAEVDLNYKKKISTGFSSPSVGFQLSDQENGHSLTDYGFKASKKESNLDHFTVVSYAQGGVDTDHHGAQESAKHCAVVEGRPNLQSPSDLVQFEEWRRCNSGKGITSKITEMKRKPPPVELGVQEPVDTNKLSDKVALVSQVFTGNVIERAGPTPSTELSQAARQPQRRPVSKFKTRQADK
ncbi:hypothetical protein GOP47_0027157 [Adiantum capillus-veneris]|nr:hypothetical protein GOP47_0027157 [Adiantum capillus-veneris]